MSPDNPELRAKVEVARQKARELEWESDPKLRARTREILAMSLLERLLLIEEEADLYDALEPADE